MRKNEYSSYEEYMQVEFPNYNEELFDVCKKCKVHISRKQFLIGSGICKKCLEDLEK